MDYQIYTFGSSDILWKVFNGISLICKNDSQYYTPFIQIAGMIGVLWVGMRALAQGNVWIFAKDWFLPSFALLTFFLTPKCNVMLIDKVGSPQHVAKIDNIPLGLGLIASASSTMAYEITTFLEEKLSPIEGDFSYPKTGTLFAAHLVALSKDLQVIDPLERQNIKDFVRQCFMWPYVFTNIEPGKEAALKSDNILKFVEENPHPSLGIYWREKGGASTFTYCKACVPKVKEILKVEETKGLQGLFGRLFGDTDEKDPLKDQSLRKLKIYFNQSWSFIAKESENTFDRVGQQMLINAYRESLDDQRERNGLTRLHPRLISYSVTRGAEQQNTGWLIMGEMSARYLPTIQAVFFALLILLFVFVVPMSLLPGGLSTLTLWVKMMFWVQSWPIFYAILNCLGYMWLQKATKGVMLPYGEGLTLQTQMGLSDAAWDAYCAVQCFSASVPFLSGFIVMRSSQMLVNMAEKMAPGVGRSLGAALTDNTQSFDTQSFHNRSIGSYQMAQQHLSPSFHAGQVIDDGNMRREMSTSGQEYFSEKISNLKQNFNMNHALEGQLSQAASNEMQVQKSLQRNLSMAQNEAFSHSADLLNAIGQGKVLNQSFSESENRSVQNTLQKMMSLDQGYGNQSALSDSSSWQHSGKAGISATLGKTLNAIGIQLEAGVSSSRTWSAEDRDTYEKWKKAGISDQDILNSAKSMNAAASQQASFSDDHSKRVAENYRGSLDRVESLQDQLSASQTRLQRISETTSFMQREGFGGQINITDDVLAYSAQKRFGGNLHQAALWQSSHAAEFKQDSQEYIAGFGEKLMNQTHSINEGGLQNLYETYKGEMTHSGKLGSLENVKSRAHSEGLDASHMENIQTEIEELKNKVQSQVQSGNLAQSAHLLESHKDRLKKEKEEIQNKFESERDRTLIGRATFRKN